MVAVSASGRMEAGTKANTTTGAGMGAEGRSGTMRTRTGKKMVLVALSVAAGGLQAHETPLTLEERVEALEAAVSIHSGTLRDHELRMDQVTGRLLDMQEWARAQQPALHLARSRWYGTWGGWFTDSHDAPNYLKVTIDGSGLSVWLNSVRFEENVPLHFDSGRITFTAAGRRFWMEHAPGGWLTDGRSRLKMRARFLGSSIVSNAHLKRTAGEGWDTMPPPPVCCSAREEDLGTAGEGRRW